MEPELVAALRNSIREIGRRVELERNDFLLQAGQVERSIYFVESGLIRLFLLTELEEHTIRFGYQGSMLNSIASFLKGHPSEFYVQVIRKSVVWVVDKTDWEAFLKSNADWKLWYADLLEDVVCQQVEREIDLLTHSPAERLKRVMERSPQLFQEVPAKYIASYLRMTPETLSRIRNS